MKLSRRNDGTAYGARAYGYDFHIVPQGKGWVIHIRELTTTAGVEHCLNQPIVHSAHEERLSDIREILDEFAMIDDYISMRWVLASGAVTARQTRTLLAELKNLGVAL